MAGQQSTSELRIHRGSVKIKADNLCFATSSGKIETAVRRDTQLFIEMLLMLVLSLWWGIHHKPIKTFHIFLVLPNFYLARSHENMHASTLSGFVLIGLLLFRQPFYYINGVWHFMLKF